MMTTKESEKPIDERVVNFHSMALSNALAKEAEKYLRGQLHLTDTEKAVILLSGTKRLSDDLWKHHMDLAKDTTTAPQPE